MNLIINLLRASPFALSLALGASEAFAQNTLTLAAPTTTPTVIDQYTNPPTDMVAIIGGGPYISFSGLPGHVPGDTERTSVEIRTASKAGDNVEETALDVEMNDTQGFTAIWQTNQAYPAGTLLKSGTGYPGNVYMNRASCTSSSSGTGPNGTTSGQNDGTCIWDYQYPDGDGKSASLLSGQLLPNGGQLWGQAIDVVARPGALGANSNLPGGLMIGLEVDTGNAAKDCPVAGRTGCLVTGIFLAGSSQFSGTSGMLGGGQPPGAQPLYHQGVTLLPGFASDVGFNDASNSAIGFQSNNTHSAYAFQDLSTSPTSINVAGTHSFAGYADTSTTPTAILLSGAYGTAGIDMRSGTLTNAMLLKSGESICFNGGDNCLVWGSGFLGYKSGGATPWFIDNSGTQTATGLSITGTKISAPSLATSGGTPAGSLCIDTSGVIYVKTSSGACK